MKYVDTPPILAILFSKQQTPPHSSAIQRDPPPKLVVFHIHSPQNRWKWSTPPPKNIHPPLWMFLTSSLKISKMLQWHLSRQHLSWQHLSISGISQLLLTQFWPNFETRFLVPSWTDSNCHCDICPGNICPGDICPCDICLYQDISAVTNLILTKL